MSGGRFDHSQYHITTIADSIQSELDRQGTEIPKKDRWSSDDWYEKYPESKFYPTYSEETQKEFKKAVEYLKLAFIYAQRIDWFLSDDDGEDTFHKRLKEELKKIDND